MKQYINEAFRLQQIAGIKPINQLSEKSQLIGKQHELDVDKDGDIEADDLADLRAMKSMKEGGDHEVAMAQASLKAIISAASQLMHKIGQEEINIPAWIQDHITNSENYIEQANQGYHELCDKEQYQSDVQVAVMEKDEE